ncbi:MAG TPA: hypothetical protein VER33_15735, partial [Polyangiaceae bacterium]|nr:hypothetical protein [Polyangiaceae bacterium]
VGSLIVSVGLVFGSARSAWAFVAYVVGFSVLSLGVLITALHAESRSHRAFFWRALTFTPLIFTGRISYGLYLLHPFAYAVAFSAAVPGDISWLRALAACAGAFALASASFYGFERHCLRLKRLFV